MFFSCRARFLPCRAVLLCHICLLYSLEYRRALTRFRSARLSELKPGASGFLKKSDISLLKVSSLLVFSASRSIWAAYPRGFRYAGRIVSGRFPRQPAFCFLSKAICRPKPMKTVFIFREKLEVLVRGFGAGAEKLHDYPEVFLGIRQPGETKSDFRAARTVVPGFLSTTVAYIVLFKDF